ncbi:methionine--tRNA ligase [Bartonella tamiae]|uniref:Methionine--tRNA ligase n=1 Tax=Bartonella tamiae Th239 TaxID=1094558 RepID=J0QSJ1_9HYPH|nr:methionine--tRNA ligase [Bartonella tamiae]EJF88836.1 methionyl-tRNA synthetase [Bartonella tamiae Th239]EJF94914.1 methionyl-tRNA synthetase [Bartonella tamiae Th307]
MRDKYYITTPIFYPNGQPHIGHAYNAIATDAMARFQRADGRDVFFLSGTDEHGLKMQQTAEKEGISPQSLADRNSSIFQNMLKVLNCSNDEFIRTTQQRHIIACQAIWKLMQENGDIYLDRYSGWYSVRQEAYYEESDTIVGDDGIRRETEVGSPVEWNEEESYFFRLSKFQQPLLDYYEKHPEFIGPNERRNEIISFVKSGLRDISISRTTFDWGVPVPDDPKHVMYVWVDALTNYLTALGFPDENAKKRDFWPANAHIIGKDIIRFHAIYWPAFLMSAKIELPKRVFAHGFLLNRGEKMSKSVGNVVDPFSMIEEYGLDRVRYFFLREVPFGQDGSYSHEAIVNRTNADLANDLGNLAQRSLSMIAKNCDGHVPTPDQMLNQDVKLFDQSEEALKSARQSMLNQAPHLALSAIFSVVAEANRYFANEEPWALRKNDPKRFATVLYTTVETLRRVGLMLTAFIPQSAMDLLDILGVEKENRLLKNVTETKIEPGTKLPSPRPIFPRYMDEKEK